MIRVFSARGGNFPGPCSPVRNRKRRSWPTCRARRRKAQVDALLNNFTHKIIHALGDVATAKWASELIGEAIAISGGGTEQSPQSLAGELLGHSVWSVSVGEDQRPILFPREFMYGFRTGGERNGYVCDGVVIRSGELFSNGQGFLKLGFSQEKRG